MVEIDHTVAWNHSFYEWDKSHSGAGMLRRTLRNAIQRIDHDLQASGIFAEIDKAMEALRQSPAKRDGETIFISFEVLSELAVAQSRYGGVENQILRIFDLTVLVDPKNWKDLTRAEDGSRGPELLFRIRNNLRFFRDHSPKVLELLRQEGPEPEAPDRADPATSDFDRAIFSVTLSEDEGQASSPQRVIQLFESVAGLYGVVAALRGQTENDLALKSCDSGSDKLFDFQGSEGAIKELRKLVVSIFEGVVFFKHRQSSADLDLISKSLPIISQINSMIETDEISRELGERLKIQTIECATKFRRSGAITEDMSAAQIESPRQLMSPSPKLLAAPTAERVDHSADAQGEAGPSSSRSSTRSPAKKVAKKRSSGKPN